MNVEAQIGTTCMNILVQLCILICASIEWNVYDLILKVFLLLPDMQRLFYDLLSLQCIIAIPNRCQ